ncbi:MAG: hypothetical protein QM765_47220 [Myxococcales bacterium]
MISGICERLGHAFGRLHQDLGGGLEAGRQQALLRLEVSVDERDVDAGVLRDIAHGRSGVALAAESLQGGVDQPLPGARGITEARLLRARLLDRFSSSLLARHHVSSGPQGTARSGL